MSTHVISIKIYIAIFLALMGLTAATVGVAFINLGPLNNVVAVGIACTKAALVILYFMHVRYSDRLVQISVVISIFFVAVLIAFTLADPMTRHWIRPLQYLW